MIANELQLSREVCEFIDKYASLFEPLYIAIQDFQQANYIMSDLRWGLIQIQVQQIIDRNNQLQSKLKYFLNLMHS